MRQDWLATSKGVNAVAVGIYAIMLSLVVFALEDTSTLLTGRLDSFFGPSGLWALSWAAIAAVFSAIMVFIWRPVLPRIVMALVSVSMASHILEQLVVFSIQQLKLAALCRIFVGVAPVVLVLHYRSTTALGKS
jgi:flagellar biosynthesis protein FlhB